MPSKGKQEGELFGVYNHCIQVNGNEINLSLYDTPSDSDFLPPILPGANVVVLVYSLLHNDLFENLENHWIPVINELSPESPIILVGTDLELQRPPSYRIDSPVTDSEIEELCRKFQLKSSHKVSLFSWRGIRDLFDDIIFTGLGQEPCFPVESDILRSTRCEIM